MKKGKLIIISGPSGVGKSTIREKIINNNKNFWYSVSMTTRKPRTTENHGIDYFFVSKKEFLKNIESNNLIEYAQVYNGDFYGTPKDEVFKKLENGIHVLLEIDVEGALIVKEKFPEVVLIFIMAPSMEELEKRLTNRYTDTKEKIIERLEKAKIEVTFKEKYDYIVINNSVDETVLDITNIIESEMKK